MNTTSTLNNSNTPLNAGSTFTGGWEDVNIFNNLIVAVKTDKDGIYKIQFSTDKVNVDSELTRYYRTNQIEPPHNFTITRQYVRIVFTNTSEENQTYFRLQTSLGDYRNLNIPTDSLISQDFDAISTRPTLFKYEVALGRRQGAKTWNKFAYNNDIDTAGEELIWSHSNGWTYMKTAETMNIVSTSTDDVDISGLGAHKVYIQGVDGNFQTAEEVVSMNGTSTVTTVNSYIGINRVSLFSSGTNDVNVGTITLTGTGVGGVQAEVPAGEGVTQQAIFYTQAKHQALADFLTINVNKLSGASPVVTLKAWVYSHVSKSKYEVFRQVIDTNVDNFITLNPSHPFVIGEKSVLYFTVETDTNNTVASCRFSLIEFRNVDA